MGGRQTAPSRASVWPGSGQELTPKGLWLMYKLCPFLFLLCPLAGFGMHKVFLSQDWYSLCPLEGRVQSPGVVAQV